MSIRGINFNDTQIEIPLNTKNLISSGTHIFDSLETVYKYFTRIPREGDIYHSINKSEETYFYMINKVKSFKKVITQTSSYYELEDETQEIITLNGNTFWHLNVYGNLTDGTNSITVADIASKGDLSTAIAGLGTVFDLKGIKDTFSDLPAEGNKIGDVWYVVSEEVGYIWLNDGTTNRWEQFGSPIDLSGYVTKTELQATNTNVSNNASSILELNSNKADKSELFSGSYNDLTDKPEMPDVSSFATTTYVDTAVSDKVVKEAGKGLSTNDYTTAEKEKLEGIEAGANNYVLPGDVVQDASYVHTDNNYTSDEKTKLASLSNYDDTEIVTDIRTLKESTGRNEGNIKDLFVNFNNLANVAKTGSYNDLSDKPTIFSGDYNDLTNKPTVPTKTSELTNDSGFITASQVPNPDLSGYATKTDIANMAKTNVDNNFTTGQTINGTVTATTFNATSDRLLKENIVDYRCKKSILDLPIKEFDYKKTGIHTIGCIAQDLQKICPEIVNTDKDGYLSIQESKLVYLLLQEVKQLKAEIDKLKGE